MDKYSIAYSLLNTCKSDDTSLSPFLQKEPCKKALSEIFIMLNITDDKVVTLYP